MKSKMSASYYGHLWNGEGNWRVKLYILDYIASFVPLNILPSPPPAIPFVSSSTLKAICTYQAESAQDTLGQ